MRFKKSVQPNEIKNEYTPETYFSINLPRAILDLHTFTLFYRANSANYQHTDVTTVVRKTFDAVSAVNDAAETITIAGHGWAEGQEVKYSNNGFGNLPGLTNGTTFFVKSPTVNAFQLALTSGGLSVAIGPGTAGQLHEISQTLTGQFPRVTRRFLPRLSSSIISDLVIKINDQEIQNTKEYGMLFAILNDIRKEYDDLDSTAADTVQEHFFNTAGIIGNISRIQAVTRPSGNTDKYYPGSKKSYFIDKWVGFLNEGNRYFDARDKDIKIIIKLAPANILYRGINSLDVTATDYTPNVVKEYPPDYVVTDIKASVDVLDEMPVMPGDFIYNDYSYTQGGFLNNSKISTTSFETNKSVNWVLGTFSNPNRTVDQELILQHCHKNDTQYGALVKNTVTLADINAKTPNSTLYSYEVAKNQKDSYLLNSSMYYMRSGDGISTCQYRLNNYDLTPPLDVISCYTETKKAFASDYKRVSNIYSFESEFFCNAIAIDDKSEEFKKIDWDIVIDPSKTQVGGYPMLFCCFKNKL
jgi:hypothetical protein